MTEDNIIPFPQRQIVHGICDMRVVLAVAGHELDILSKSMCEFRAFDRSRLHPALYERKRRGLARKIEEDAAQIARTAAGLAELARLFSVAQCAELPSNGDVVPL